MWNLIKKEFHNYISEIINNYEKLNNKYWLSKRDIEWLYNTKWKVKTEKCISLLNIVNEVYNTNYKLEDLFNREYMKDYLEYKQKVNIDYWNTDKWSFIDNILRIVKDTFEKIMNIFPIKNKINNDENGLWNSEIFNNIHLVIFIWIILYILWKLFNTYFL